MVRGEGLARHEALSTALGALAERARPLALARDRQLPVPEPLAPLLAGGALRRGTVVAVDAGPGVGGATSLALALAAGPSQAGSWAVAVGLGSLGLVAASGLGVSLDRFVLVPDPAAATRGDGASGGDGRGGTGWSGERRGSVGWAEVVAALVDGFDVVLVGAGPGARHRAADGRRLVARVRERGAVLVVVGGELPGERSPARLTITASTWRGLGQRSAGHLAARRVTVEATGRGEASRPRRAELWLPSADGKVAPVEPAAEPVLLRPRRAGRRAEPGESEVVAGPGLAMTGAGS